MRRKELLASDGDWQCLHSQAADHVEGPSPAPDDDLVLEAKEMVAFDGDSCVSIPRTSEAFRVVEGLQQMGRFDQRIVVAMPGLAGARPDGVGWWVRGWDCSPGDPGCRFWNRPTTFASLRTMSALSWGRLILPSHG